MGLTHRVITSDGDKVPTPRFLRRTEQKLARAQRCLSRKQKSSNNRTKARHRVAKAISDVGWHQLTQQLTYKAERYGRDFVQIGK
ncbi:transposase [Halomonas qaidamensis]|uniref:transposase n=1 Tax=Halomonas qaidamensis TaxID=2866211 RepID=UPI0029F47F61|nr:transposase [Halomonas qaidamensis]